MCVSPAPPGTILIVNRLSMMVNAVVRPANGTVATGDPANPTPASGLEYVLITLSITCREEADANCTLDPAQEFVLLDTTGAPALPRQGVTGVPGLLGNVTFAGGTKAYGSLLFEVGVEERDLELVYQELGGAADACMALPYWMTVAIVTPTPIPVTPSPSPTPSITPTPADTPTPTPTFTPTPILLPESGLYDAPNAYPIPVTWVFIGGVGALAWFWLRLRSFLSRKD